MSGRATAADQYRQPAQQKQDKCAWFRNDDIVRVEGHGAGEANDPSVHTGAGLQGIAHGGDNGPAELRVRSECRRRANLPEDILRVGTVFELD